MDFLSQFCPNTILSGILITLFLVLVIPRFLAYLSAPGPWGVPILGYYPFIGRDLHIQLYNLSKKYGEVYRLNVLGQEYVHLGTAKAIREAHINQADSFTRRQEDHVLINTIFANGLVTLNDEAWKYQRKFFLQCMRDSGIGGGKEQLKGPVEDAVQYTLHCFRKSRGKVIDLMPVLLRACTDSVVRLFLGNDVSDDVVYKINDCYVKATAPAANLNVLMAGTLANNFFFRRIPGYSDMVNNVKDMKKLLQVIVDDHRSTVDINHPPRDFVDHYLRQRYICKEKGDDNAKYFTDEGLLGTLVQAYGDGSSSVGLFVAAFLHALSFHSDIQDQIHDEIVSVVGSERLPVMEDKPNLSLLNSTIKELLRTTHLSPLLPGLLCTKDTTLLGVKIPKGCATVVNYWAANNDLTIHDNPDKFDPTRFLPGKSKVEQPVNFGIGKRACVGESLVMMEMFLFLAAILQNFLLLPADEEPDSKDKKEQKYDDFHVIVVPRARGRFNSATGNA